MTKEVNKGGKPRLEFDWKVFDALMQFKVSKAFCADYMSISVDTIEKRLREKFDMTFTEYNKFKMQRTSAMLQQKAIEMALKGNATMMIFSLKNISGWQDKLEHDISDKAKNAIKLAYNID